MALPLLLRLYALQKVFCLNESRKRSQGRILNPPPSVKFFTEYRDGRFVKQVQYILTFSITHR